jgi:hypothetical protein
LEAWAGLAMRDKPLRALASAIKAPLSDAGAEAASTLLTSIADTRVSRFRWRWLALWHRKTLKKHASLWGALGYALVAMEDYRGCRRWLSDYASRHGVAPWQLSNLTLSLRHLGKDREAAQAHGAALGLPEDHTSGRHRVWSAFFAAVAGDVAAARAHLESDQARREGEENFAKAVTEVVLASDTLATIRGYRVIVPLRFALASLVERTGIDLDRDHVWARLLGRAVERIAVSRPWLQRLWIRLTWGRP